MEGKRSDDAASSPDRMTGLDAVEHPTTRTDGGSVVERQERRQNQQMFDKYQVVEELTEIVSILAIAGIVVFAGDVGRVPLLVIGSIAIGKRLIRGVGG